MDPALLAFEIVWTIGVIWMLFIKWPANLRMHFWRRSPLHAASFVRVWSPAVKTLLAGGADVKDMEETANKLEGYFNWFFAAVYSDVSLPTASGQWEVCPVLVSAAGERFITHRLRQLVYSVAVNAFVPVVCAVPSAVDDLLRSATGLTSREAQLRLARVGPNTIQVPEPNVINVLVDEFNKGFYTYQAFMSWTWFNFGYFLC